jgi:hypothetical protein
MTQVNAHQSADDLQSAMMGWFGLGALNDVNVADPEVFNQNLTIFENQTVNAL